MSLLWQWYDCPETFSSAFTEVAFSDLTRVSLYKVIVILLECGLSRPLHTLLPLLLTGACRNTMAPWEHCCRAERCLHSRRSPQLHNGVAAELRSTTSAARRIHGILRRGLTGEVLVEGGGRGGGDEGGGSGIVTTGRMGRGTLHFLLHH